MPELSDNMKWDNILNPWQDALIEYLSNPMDERTVKDFCDEYKLDKLHYYRFLKYHKDKIYPEVDKRRKKFWGEMRIKAYKALVKRLEKSDKALQMFFEMSGDYTPKTEQKVEYSTPEQKRDKIKAMLEKLVDKYPANKVYKYQLDRLNNNVVLPVDTDVTDK